ncbi:MAG: ABC transporter ATP-binding protein, partial [Acidimicrobiia bacterium]
MSADDATTDRETIQQARASIPPGPAGRMAMATMPVERSANFGTSTKRLIARLRPERVGVTTVLAFALVSVSLAVVGPRILGRATNIVFDGLRGKNGASGIDFGHLHRVLLLAAGLYVAAATLQWLQAYLLAGVVQRTMQRLRADVEDKLNRLPLRYVDGQPRGDLLSRVTNDIDNVAQSLQQTLSMMLTSTLTLVGVLGMMFSISWILALVALVTIPLSLFTVKFVSKRSRKRFISQW